MTNVQDNTQKQIARNAQESARHHSWIGSIFEKIIAEERAAINTDFPLSGGEEHPHVYYTHDNEENVIMEEKRNRRRSTFLDHLDCEFPLSGGES
jgi:hypothetical protein